MNEIKKILKNLKKMFLIFLMMSFLLVGLLMILFGGRYVNYLDNSKSDFSVIFNFVLVVVGIIIVYCLDRFFDKFQK